MNYIPLHVHSTASLLDGIASPEDLAVRASELGFPAMAVTDHGSISAAIKFTKACKANNIKPIVGIEAYFCDDVSVTKGQKNYHIVLLTKSERGLKSLYRLMSNAHRHFYYRPRIDMDMLYDTEDLIVSTACAYGLLNHPNYEKVIRILYEYFEDDLFLEIMPLNFDVQETTNKKAFELHKEYGIKVIATGDTHYLKPEDTKLHNFLLNLHTDGKLQFDVTGLYLKSSKEFAKAFKEIVDYLPASFTKQAFENTLLVAERCNVDIPEHSIVLPKLYDEDSVVVLNREIKKRIPLVYPLKFRHQARLDYELEVINQKGFTDYFLLVYDLVRWAKSNHVPLGPGRGSAAGSLVCYLLGITDLDPIDEGLMFERFLNPERTDYPDIDLDFSQKQRYRAIQYLQEKYGNERVSYISTVSKLKPKSAWKEVARKLAVPFKIANNISEHLDDTITFAEVVAAHPNIEELVAPVPIEDLVYYTDGLTNTQRHESKHAAGIVIAPSKIEDYGVLEVRKDSWSINWDMNDVSHQGLVKIDVLGLRTLDILDECVDLVRTRHKKTIDWSDIDLNDPIILKEFELGNTIGIFQFEKYSTRSLVRQLAPIDDKRILVDCNALVRPGPLDSGMTQQYIQRHTGKDAKYEEAYLPWLESEGIAEDTYRVIIYQEQVIEVLQKLAGYSTPQADVVRRVMAKKKGDFELHRKEFVNGCKKTVSMPSDIANVLFDNLETFSRYGFNKSHAAAYTLIGLRQMHLKTRYPLEYMASLFKFTTEKEKKIKFIDDCERLKIPVFHPDINLSSADFSIDHKGVRIGLSAVKDIGEKGLAHIEKQRKMGPFKSAMDFRLRVPKAQINGRAMNSLVYSGCFDSLKINQRAWIERKTSKDGTITMPDVEDYSVEQKEMSKHALLPGIWKMHIKPELGLNLDEEALESLRGYILQCTDCPLQGFYESPTSFEYSADSKILMIAEAPGEDEMRSGRPLFGKAGDEWLIKILRPFGFKRSDFFLSNVYKCRPLDNKLPADVSHKCWDILSLEIETLQPKLIVASGNRAREFFTGQTTGIQAAADRLRCEVEVVDGRPIPILYTVHPASVFYSGGEENRNRLIRSAQVLASIRDGLYEEDFDGEEEFDDEEIGIPVD